MALRIGVVFFLSAAGYAACCQNPMEPSGFPVNPAKDSRLAPPRQRDGETYEFKLLQSDSWEVRGNLVSGKGVEFEYRGYHVKANEAEGDLDTSQFALKGNVNLLTQDGVVRGSQVFVDFKARTFRFLDGNADLRKSLLQGRVLSDVYLRAIRVEGSESLIHGTGTGLTTCNLDYPHFIVESRSVTVEPNRRLVFDDFRLKLGKTTVLGLPRFVVPLNKRADGVLPDVGTSADEGVYAKTRIGLPLGGDTAIGRLDLMSKKGVGLGTDYDFRKGTQKGGLRLYTTLQGQSGKPSYNASGRYSFDASWGKFEATRDERQFSYLSGTNSTSSQTSLRFSPKQAGGAQTLLSFTQNGNRTGLFGSDATNVSLTDVRSESKALKTSVQINWAKNEARFGATTVSQREVVETRLHTSYDLSRFVAELDYQRNIPVGANFNFIGGLDRTPELTLKTDSKMLFGDTVPKWLPRFSALVSAGNYRDGFNLIDVGRYFFDVRLSQRPSPRTFSLSYDAGFRQGVYTDGTAQYTPSANLVASYKVGKKVSANARYNYSRLHGYSPIQSDRSGNYSVASVDMSAEAVPGLTVGAQAGFDFNRDSLGQVAWVSPAVRLEYKPRDWFRVRALGSYLPQSSSWGNARMDVSWKAGDTFVGVALRYDAIRNTWGNANLFVDAFKWGKLKVSALLLYNGYLQRFDSRHLALTYDLHCAEAVLQVLENNTGFRSGREVLFFVRIKAFPFSSPFGSGRAGQPLDFGTGGGW